LPAPWRVGGGGVAVGGEPVGVLFALDDEHGRTVGYALEDIGEPVQDGHCQTERRDDVFGGTAGVEVREGTFVAWADRQGRVAVVVGGAEC
jgi:hypothetical protein